MRTNWFYLFVGLLFVVMIYVSLRFFKSSRFSTVGVTYAREYKINAEKPALVSSISVVPGQQVKKGDRLAELSSSQLELELAKIASRIQVLRSEKDEKSKRVTSTLDLLKSENKLQSELLQSEIDQLENETKLNRTLTVQFTNDTVATLNSAELKLRSLRQQRERHAQALEIKVKDILQQHTLDQQLLANEIALLENELKLINKEKESLSKFASADGVIANVYVRPDEQVDAFTPLLSIVAIHPSTVVAYQANEKQALVVGAPVDVASYDRRNITIQGKIIGFGAVVQLPDILQKATAVKAFGREVFIEIDENNPLATGEKVLVR
jgi:multidrug resistance efflux pump